MANVFPVQPAELHPFNGRIFAYGREVWSVLPCSSCGKHVLDADVFAFTYGGESQARFGYTAWNESPLDSVECYPCGSPVDDSFTEDEECF